MNATLEGILRSQVIDRNNAKSRGASYYTIISLMHVIRLARMTQTYRRASLQDFYKI